MTPTDADIMARVQEGDREVFGLLVARYAPRLLRVAKSKLGDAALAEDAVQETFLAAYRARQTYQPQFAVSTWLWTILLNLCRRHWQRRQTGAGSLWQTVQIDAPDPADEQTPSALAWMIQQENRRRLHGLLAELPEVHADALRLRFFGGLSYEEIASTMECSLSGAKRRVKTGLERLSKRIRSLEPPAVVEAAAIRKEEDQ